MVIAVASPSRMSKKKLARIFEHELLHVKGKTHEDMTRRQYWSVGDEPAWARGSRKLRHVRRGESILEKPRKRS